MATVHVPSGREIELADADANPIAAHGYLWFGIYWIPTELSRRQHRSMLRVLDKDALQTLDREGPLTPTELTEALQLSGRFKDRRLGTDVVAATVEDWLGHAHQRRLVESETGDVQSAWRITQEGTAFLKRLKTPSAALRAVPAGIRIVASLLSIVVILVGGAAAVPPIIEAQGDVLIEVGKVVALILGYGVVLTIGIAWFTRAFRRKRIGVLQVLRENGRLPAPAPGGSVARNASAS